jgi:hypothetical protein
MTRARIGVAVAAAGGVLAVGLDAAGGRADAEGSSLAATTATIALAVAIVAALSARIGRTSESLPSQALPWPSRRDWVWASTGLVIVVGVLLHAQLAMPTGVPDYGDPLFSSWRLAWFAHQLPRAPWHLFDANIYHPAARTLAYSDATIVEGAIAAPFLWLGAPVIVVYNGLLIGSFVAAGLGMFALARAVTGQPGAAFLAALAFACDPYRITEYTHLEMQFTCWMPLAVLMLLRTLAAGRRRDGVWLAALVSLQALSSLYYGAYLSVALVAVAVGWVATRGWPTLRAWTSLAIGIGIATTVAVALTSPYRANQSTVGERSASQVRFYSATAAHYLIAGRESAVYGARLLDRRPDGLYLFTGFTPVALASLALVPPAGPLVAATSVGLLATVDASFGLNGTVYTWLERLGPFHGFRVAGRFRAVVGVFLSLLAGLGVARIRSRAYRAPIIAVAAVLLVVEAYPQLELRSVWTHGPDIYARVPDGAVVVDLPLLEDGDSVFTYLSTFHWHPIVNGSSGFEPSWYPALASAAGGFPDNGALDALTRVGAQYVVIHEAYYRQRFAAVAAAADAQPRLQFVAATTWDEGDCRLYQIR